MQVRCVKDVNWGGVLIDTGGVGGVTMPTPYDANVSCVLKISAKTQPTATDPQTRYLIITEIEIYFYLSVFAGGVSIAPQWWLGVC